MWWPGKVRFILINMAQPAKTIPLVLRIIFVVFFCLFTLSVYVAVTFFVGGHHLLGGVMANDSWSFISRLKLLADYFPKYPFWNFLEGSGVSLTHSYPILTHTLIVITSKLFNLTLVESYKFWEFASVVLFGFGVFVYARVRLKASVVAFLAGLFYIASPIAWIWLFEWGFIAEAIAGIFFPPTILFYDLLILRVIKGDYSPKTRILFVLTVIFLSLSFLAHPTVFTGEMSLIITYTALLVIFRKDWNLGSLLLLLKNNLLLIFAFFGLTAFWLWPFYKYLGVARSSDVGGAVREDEYYRNDLEIKHILSFERPEEISKEVYFKRFGELGEGDVELEKFVVQKGSIFKNFSFPYALSVLYFFGLATSFLLWKQKLPHLFFTSLLGLLAVASTPFLVFLAKIPIISNFASWRSFIFIDRLLLPVVAAFAGWGVFSLVFLPLRFIDRYLLLKIARTLILSLAAVSFTALILYRFRYMPNSTPTIVNYGKGGIDLRDFWGERVGANQCTLDSNYDQKICHSEKISAYFNESSLLSACQQLAWGEVENLPAVCRDDFSEEDIEDTFKNCDAFEPFEYKDVICYARENLLTKLISDLSMKRIKEKLIKFWQKDFEAEDLKKVFSLIPDGDFERYDTGPGSAVYSMAGPYLKKTPSLSVYINQSSLIHRLWGYQISNFYAQDKVYNDPTALPEIADWFGVKYMIGGGNEKFKSAGFEEIDPSVFVYQKAEPIISVSRKPLILVVGRDTAPRVYEDVFKKVPFGIIDYNEAVLVKGKEFLEDYTLEELKNFELIFLYGYKERSKSKAWGLLDQYIQGGGRLFIDTGWEYTSADWNAGETAGFFPTTTLSWTNFGKTGDFSLHEGLINLEGVEVGKFEPLIWEDTSMGLIRTLPWGVSSGDELRTWAQPILTVNGNPLIAGGNYGRGKVIWSGMNLFAHIKVFDSKHPEAIFAGRLFDWLLAGLPVDTFEFAIDFKAERPNPDRVLFTFDKEVKDASLYFKEAYHPYWRARLISGGRKDALKILTAGPGFMLVDLGKVDPGDTVEFKIIKPLGNYFAQAISLLTFGFLLIYIFKPGFISGAFPVKKLKIKMRGPFKWDKNEETEY